jgi:two-component system, OmpR family, sensor kinase
LSIRRQLLVALLLALLATGLGASGATWFAVRKAANDLFDYHLEQMALSLADQTLATPAQAAVPLGQDYVVQVWDATGVLVYISRTGAPLPLLRGGFDSVSFDGDEWRVFTLHTRDRAIQVAAPADLRSGRATAVALRTLLPILASIPLYGFLIWLIVGHGLRPLTEIAGAIRRRDPASLDPLPERPLPEEVAPMVSELNGLLARLREALDKQKRFTADAAHELRSPLTALQIQLDMLSRARSGDETRDAVDGLRAGVKRAGRLVEQLLTMARLEPQSQTNPVPVALDQLLTEVATELEPLAEARRVQLRLARLERATIQGEPQALHALVRNLIDNAIRYTPPGGEVRLALFTDAGATAIVVEDTGPGIPAADRARVFDRFSRLPGASAEGSGLGLAIVKQVAGAHGATVELGEGDGGRGLRVTVRFERA